MHACGEIEGDQEGVAGGGCDSGVPERCPFPVPAEHHLPESAEGPGAAFDLNPVERHEGPPLLQADQRNLARSEINGLVSRRVRDHVRMRTDSAELLQVRALQGTHAVRRRDITDHALPAAPAGLRPAPGRLPDPHERDQAV